MSKAYNWDDDFGLEFPVTVCFLHLEKLVFFNNSKACGKSRKKGRKNDFASQMRIHLYTRIVVLLLICLPPIIALQANLIVFKQSFQLDTMFLWQTLSLLLYICLQCGLNTFDEALPLQHMHALSLF